MDNFVYRERQLHADGVALSEIAGRFGTPTYVYSRRAIEARWREFDQAFSGLPHLVCYAVKANSSLGVLNVLARLGSGFDIVSVGELERVLRAGGDARKVVFAGVGKRADEMRRALEVGIRCFNVESEAELERLNRVAGELGKEAPVSIRVNPDVDAETHPYIATGMKENKFGIAMEQAMRVYDKAQAMPHVQVIGAGCHIGSQLTQVQPFTDAVQRLLGMVDRLAGAGIALTHLDIGGGVGIRYQDETPPAVEAYAATMKGLLAGRDLEVVLEPGRAIVGNAGVLLTRVEYLKCTADRNFAIVDAAMTDLIRPALYEAWHEILPVRQDGGAAPAAYDIVGPVCESADFLGHDRALNLAEGDLLAICSAGAYGFVMSSTYNARPRAAEVMVEDEQAYLVRRRETIDDLMIGESVPPT